VTFELYKIFIIITLVLHILNIVLSVISIKKVNNAGLFTIIIVSILFVFSFQLLDFIYYISNPSLFVKVSPLELISFFGSIILALIITLVLLTPEKELMVNRKTIPFHPIDERYFYKPAESIIQEESKLKKEIKARVAKTTQKEIEEEIIEKPEEAKLSKNERETKIETIEQNESKQPIVAKFIKQDLKTEQEKLKSELAKVTFQRDKLVSIISHDLRTPLNSVFGYVQLLKDGHYKNKQEVKKFSENIFDIAKQQLNALNKIVEWIRYESSNLTMNPTDFDVTSTINFVVKTMARFADAKRIKIIVNSKPELFVYGDEFMIIDVIKDLLDNAIKFSHPDNTIEVNVHFHEKLNKLIVLVADSGIGIDREILLNLLVSTKKLTARGTMGEKGLGLGLLIVKAIIDMHGESFWIASEKGKWTRVYFTLSPTKRA